MTHRPAPLFFSRREMLRRAGLGSVVIATEPPVLFTHSVKSLTEWLRYSNEHRPLGEPNSLPPQNIDHAAKRGNGGLGSCVDASPLSHAGIDLDRAGPVARQQALVPCDPLYEYRPGEFARQQMRASGQRLGTEWMRRLDLELMAGSP